jgi:hypothetical protein
MYAAPLQCACSTPPLTFARCALNRRVGIMSASDEQRAEWLDSQFWERLDRLEIRHQQVQSQHEAMRRDLDRVMPCEADELRRAWRRYCEVIAELQQTTAEFESLRSHSG